MKNVSGNIETVFSNLDSLKRKKIFQKGKCQFFWKACQISCNYFSYYQHYIMENKKCLTQQLKHKITSNVTSNDFFKKNNIKAELCCAILMYLYKKQYFCYLCRLSKPKSSYNSSAGRFPFNQINWFAITEIFSGE